MRDWATPGTASVLWLWAGLAFGPVSVHASQASAAAVDSLATTPAPVRTSADDAIEGHPISRIDVEARDIFDPVPPGRLGPIYRLADRLHVSTRPSTVRTHLLLAPGQTWTAPRARESERALRALEIFGGVRVTGRPEGDSVAVSILTRDAWTTTPEIAIERGGGRVFGSVRFAERNLLGRAQQVAVSYREDPAGISRSVDLADPGVRGTHAQISASASEGSGGSIYVAAVGLPFYAEDTPRSFGVRADRFRTTARLFAGGVEAANFSRRLDRVEIWAGRGRRFDAAIGRLTGALLIQDHRFGPSTLLPGAPAAFDAGIERLALRRLSVEGELWRPEFIERTGVEQLDGIEDIDLGRSLALGVGFSPSALGGTVDEGYAAARLRAGVDGRDAGFGWVRLGFSARLASGLRESSGQVEARWVNQSIPRHTLVVAARGAGGWRPARDFQLVAGGLNGLRAHEVYALTGTHLWRWNAESRWALRHSIQHLLSVGAAAFWDAARARGPGSGNLAWQHDLGFGLRLGFPRSALNHVARFDIAWTVAPSGPGPRRPVFSFGSSQAF